MGNGALSWEQSLPLTWVSHEWAAVTTGIFPTHIWPPENPDYIFISKTIDLAASQRIRKERSEYLLNEHHSSVWKIKSTKLNMEKSIKRA